MCLGSNACGGGSGIIAPPVSTSGAVTFSMAPGNVCCAAPYTITVQPQGTATKSAGGVPIATVPLTPALNAQIFSDVRAAWPLNKLPVIPVTPDSGTITVSWDGETTPNILTASTGIEGALITDFSDLNLAFNP